MARKEKQQKKAARRMERRSEKTGLEEQPREENPQLAVSVSGPKPETLLKLVK
jgi:hypothetical protein